MIRFTGVGKFNSFSVPKFVHPRTASFRHFSSILYSGKQYNNAATDAHLTKLKNGNFYLSQTNFIFDYKTKNLALSVDIELDTTILKNLTNNIVVLMKNKAPDMIKNVAKSFLIGAVRFTPPRSAMGRDSLKHDTYLRKVETLKALEQKNELTAKDAAAKNRGMKYKVFRVSKDSSNTEAKGAFGYTKTAAEARDMSKIVNRGLARWSWGSNAQAEIQPRALRTLQQRAPNLSKYRFNKVELTKENNGNVSMTFVNRSKNASNYLGFALAHGYDNANRTIIKYAQNFEFRDYTFEELYRKILTSMELEERYFEI